MYIKIVSPERCLYEGNITSIIVPGARGEFEILENHAPIISSLSKGVIKCRGQEEQKIFIETGFIEVVGNKITVCVELQ